MGAARSGSAPSEADRFARRRAKCPTVPVSHNSSVPNSQLLHTTRTKRCRLPFPTIIYHIVFHESELFAPFFSERKGGMHLHPEGLQHVCPEIHKCPDHTVVEGRHRPMQSSENGMRRGRISFSVLARPPVVLREPDPANGNRSRRPGGEDHATGPPVTSCRHVGGSRARWAPATHVKSLRPTLKKKSLRPPMHEPEQGTLESKFSICH